MAQLSSEEFEALWQEAQKLPVVREAVVKPVHLDVSLSGILDRYMTMADQFLAQGKISKIDHDALVAAVTALKAILARINEKELVAQVVADRAKMLEQQVQDRIANLTSTFRR
jgi:hypothetical protein